MLAQPWAWLTAASLAAAPAGPTGTPATGRCAQAPQLQDWGGAYFRKVVSRPSTSSRGIAAEGVLPRFYYDLLRYYTPTSPKLEWQIGPLDRGSLYLGGNGDGKELDAGLTWNRVYDERARPAFTDGLAGTDGRDPRHRFFKVEAAHGGEASIVDAAGATVVTGNAAVASFMKRVQPDYAFRPFWRTTNNGGNQWNKPEEGAPNNVYFYPAEPFTMRLELVADQTFRMDIATAGGASFSITFKQEGFRSGLGGPERTFKRVNSIDQYVLVNGERHGNENRDVIATNAKALGLRWQSVHVLEPAGEVALAGDECVEVHGRDTDPSYDRIFHISQLSAEGGERVDITAQWFGKP